MIFRRIFNKLFRKGPKPKFDKEFATKVSKIVGNYGKGDI